MNRAYLRPPVALFQMLGVLVVPLVIWAVISVWQTRLPELQRIYLTDYLKLGVLPDLSGIRSMLDFSRGKKAAKIPTQVVICYQRPGEYIPARGTTLDWSRDPRPVVMSFGRKAWAAWLEKNVFGCTWIALLLPPLLISTLLSSAWFVGAWHLDQERHLKFRSQGRQLRGPVMRTRADFRRVVWGNGLGWRVEARRSPFELLRSGWLAVSFLVRGEGRAASREVFSGRQTKVLRINPELESHHAQLIGDTGSGKTQAILHILDEVEARSAWK